MHTDRYHTNVEQCEEISKHIWMSCTPYHCKKFFFLNTHEKAENDTKILAMLGAIA